MRWGITTAAMSVRTPDSLNNTKVLLSLVVGLVQRLEYRDVTPVMKVRFFRLTPNLITFALVD